MTMPSAHRTGRVLVTATAMLLATGLLWGMASGTLARSAGDPCRGRDDAACVAERQARCRQAIDAMLRTMRATPLETSRDRADVAALLARIEKMLADNRRDGLDDCRSWAELGRIVATY